MIRTSRLAANLAGVFVLCAAFVPVETRAQVAAETATSQASRNKTLVSAAFQRWSDGGTDFFTEMLAPDVVWTIEGSGPSAGRFEGRETFIRRAVRPFVTRLSTPVRPVETEVWADGDHVIIRWEGEAVAGDGAPYENSYVWIFRMADDRAVEVTAFLDLVPYDDVLRRIPEPVGQDGGRP